MSNSKMKTVIVFDLDDTLYDEISYVKSGFHAVAKYLEEWYGIPSQASFDWMWQCLRVKGRGSIFNDVLKHYGCYSNTLVKKCLGVYRTHYPNIKLCEEAEKSLEKLSKYPIYIVTDGNKTVQHKKLESLELYKRVSKCYVTYRYGIRHSKPSPYCFFKIAEREQVTPDRIVYIGDNSNKDFVGIKPYGFKTVRIMRGQYKEIERAKEFEAEYRIESLQEITEKFLNKIFE
jgi:putative hydrolase of the HAD superfamily